MSDPDTQSAPRGRPFTPGQSGNPKGRPKGSRNAVTLLAEALLNDEAEAIIRKVVDKALEGDSAAMRLAIERMIPAKRQRTITVDFEGEINTAADAARASSAIVSACVRGEISWEEATQISSLIESHLRILTAVEVETRLAALERGVLK